MKKRYPFIRAVMIVVYAFIFLPIFIVALMSFNASQYGTFPFVFSTKWYVRLFTGASLGGATWLSIWFSLLVTLTMVVVGVMTSLGLKRSNAKFAKVFSALLNMGVIIPWLVLGVALLMIFNFIGLGRSYLGMYLGNSICVLPYVVLLVYPAPALFRSPRHLEALQRGVCRDQPGSGVRPPGPRSGSARPPFL